ncbi:MAG: hypothetical protein EOM21_20960 [Gammaproteobacteria bacterium]|nr:hypothetical protein [Gammaproteobacteria bacterium]
MREPDFTKASHPFKKDFIEWCEDVLYLGLGDVELERARNIGLARAKAQGKPMTTTLEQLRYYMYDSYIRGGWDPAELRRMGFKPSSELGAFPGSKRAKS